MSSYYHVWFDRKAGTSAHQVASDLRNFLDAMVAAGLIEDYSLTRRKLRLGPDDLGDFHVTVVVRDLGQLDRAFDQVSQMKPPLATLHAPLFAQATNVRAAVYRDFPDEVSSGGGGD